MPRKLSTPPKTPAPTPSTAPVCYTLAGFCAAYGVGRSFVYGLFHSGALHPVKAGKLTLIRRVDAEAWVASLPAAFGKAA